MGGAFVSNQHKAAFKAMQNVRSALKQQINIEFPLGDVLLGIIVSQQASNTPDGEPVDLAELVRNWMPLADATARAIQAVRIEESKKKNSGIQVVPGAAIPK